MAGLTATGIGSGLDIENIITSLVAVESIPLNVLKSRQKEFETQLSDYGKFKSAISSFQTSMQALDSLDDFKIYTATSSSESVFTATASSTAAAGTYDIVVSTLAEAHKMGSASVADKDTTTFGSAGDTMTLTIGAENFVVDTGAKTLEGIRDAINAATDNIGITATIVSETASSYRLVLSSDNSGTDNTMSLAFADSGLNPIADPLTMGTINAAVNSSFTLDGYTIERSSNKITDAVDGITLDLLTTSASSLTLTVNKDDSAVKEAVQSFVTSYNSLKGTIDDLRGDSLEGDSTLLSIQSQIRSVLNTPPTGLTTGMSYLSELGITTKREDGKLSLDSSLLQTKLDTDFDGVAELFAHDDQGFAFRMEALADQFLDIEGVIKAREDGINTRIDDTKDDIVQMEYRLNLIEERYRIQFTALDTLLSQLQSTSNYLSQQLTNLPKISSK